MQKPLPWNDIHFSAASGSQWMLISNGIHSWTASWHTENSEVVHAEPLQGSTVNSPDQWILSWVTSVCHIKTLAGATHLGPHQNYTEDPPEAPWGTTTFWAAETLQLGLKRAETSEMKTVL